MIHKGVYSIIFSYLGVGKDLAFCRLVCKKWKSYVKSHLNDVIYVKKGLFEQIKSKIPEFKDEDIKEEFETASNLKKSCINFRELLPLKYSLFHRISDLGRLLKPPSVLRYGICSVLFLILSHTELRKISYDIEWKVAK